MTNVGKKQRSPLVIVTAIVAVIVVILFATAAHGIADTAKGYSYGYDARDYLYAAENGRFGDLYDTAVRDMDKDADYSVEVSEYRALAFYYEQAVLEHAYRTAGDDETADKLAKRMEEYESQLGSMSAKAAVVRDAIDAATARQ